MSRFLWASTLRRHQLIFSLAGLGLSIGLLASRVSRGPTPFDEFVARLLSPGSVAEGRSHLAVDFWSDVTALGGGPIVALVVTGAAGFLFVAGKKARAGVLLACVVAAASSNLLLKALFERPRPLDLPTIFGADSYSFPSGHSAMSGTVYPLLFAIVASSLSRRRLRAYCLGCGFFLMLLVGVSRVYLGVHFATDVLAGWALGLSWALICWVLVARLKRRGMLRNEQALAPDAPPASSDSPP